MAKSRPFHLVHLHNRAARVREHDVGGNKNVKRCSAEKIVRIVKFFRGVRDLLLVTIVTLNVALCI